MNLLEKGDALISLNKYNQNTFVLTPKLWTVCFTEYLKYTIPNLSNVIKSYTMYDDFYNENIIIENFIKSFDIILSKDTFKLDEKNKKLYINDSYTYTYNQILIELFYNIKLGISYDGIPSHIVYFVKECFKNDIPNTYSIHLLPDFVFKDLTSRNLENSIEIISDIIGYNFVPFTSQKTFLIKDDIIEFYVPLTDSVGTAPKSLLNHISLKQLKNVTIENGYLSLNHTPLHVYCNKKGYFKSSGYDIVKCI